jgi:hypothetical protein
MIQFGAAPPGKPNRAVPKRPAIDAGKVSPVPSRTSGGTDLYFHDAVQRVTALIRLAFDEASVRPLTEKLCQPISPTAAFSEKIIQMLRPEVVEKPVRVENIRTSHRIGNIDYHAVSAKHHTAAVLYSFPLGAIHLETTSVGEVQQQLEITAVRAA